MTATPSRKIRWAVVAMAWMVAFPLSWFAPTRSAFAYLAAFVGWYSIYVALLLWIMIVHACRATSMVVVRRFAERMLAAGPLLVLMFLPVVLAHRELFPWVATPGLLSESERHLVPHKLSWLGWFPFAVRGVAYVAIPVGFGEGLIALSRRQDGGEDTSLRMIRISIVGLVVTALCLTWASFDWIMALDPVFYSNVLGVYLFAGAMCGALSIVTLGACTARRAPWTIPGVSTVHVHALGKWLLAFICFWAYIAFSQGMLIWIADLPQEVGWFIVRTEHGWQGALIVLIVGRFFVPFFGILGRRAKSSPRWLSVVCVWLLLMHFLDCHLAIVPSLRQHFEVSASDVLFSTTLGATLFEFCRMRSRSWQLRPEGDPCLPRSLAYRGLS